VLAEIALRLRNARASATFRAGSAEGAGVLVPQGDSRDAGRLFERLQAVLRDRPVPTSEVSRCPEESPSYCRSTTLPPCSDAPTRRSLSPRARVATLWSRPANGRGAPTPS
jgi:hypothetical protein